MSKKHSNLKQYLLGSYLILLFVASNNSAEIYKRVDANGKTHYSDKKIDAGKLVNTMKKIKSIITDDDILG